MSWTLLILSLGTNSATPRMRAWRALKAHGAAVLRDGVMASFGLEAPALQRLGSLVHYLDVGGVQPPEAAGIARLLGGLRESITNDDRLLATASAVFDGLLAAFETDGKS